MRRAVMSEVLRAVSGYSLLAVHLVALLMPLFVLFSDGSRFAVSGLDPETASMRLLEPLAWTAISAAFVSAYGVTRESYYVSMDRTLTGVGFPRAFVGKLVAGALVAVALSLAMLVVWTLGVSILLSRNGMSLVLGPDAWRLFAGAMLGALLGSVIGGAVGWIARNYYVTAAVILLLPMAVEFALLRTAPDVARFSPGLTLVALGVPGYQGRLLEFAPAFGLALVWAVALVAVAWMRGRRRLS